ncbi:hypothetical protein [Spiroplasma endosymbiont of Polydrusus pterygomalis]|uniref:hypothetical protein n=1 Tax=Spiroplasma endosymbiont of Polydrusus pterygomalis TaxID=3139327 RepID=UPI003CCB24BC
MSIGLIMLIIWICFVFWVVFLIWGIILCSSNNALGVLLLFLTLNVFGLIIGLFLLYNSKNKQTVAMEKKYLSEKID